MSVASVEPMQARLPSVDPEARYSARSCGCTGEAIAFGCSQKDKDRECCLVDVRRHTARLYCALNEMKDLKLLGNHFDRKWKEVQHHLFLAQAIGRISSKSSFFLGTDDYMPCSVWKAVDDVMDGRSESYLTASLRFNLIWTALEVFGKLAGKAELPERKTKKDSANAIAKMSSTLGLKNLIDMLDDHFLVDDHFVAAASIIRRATAVIGTSDAEFVECLSADERDGGSTFDRYRNLVRMLRNNYVHGHETLWWPTGDELLPERLDAHTSALIARHNAASRIMLMLMQLSLVRLSLSDATVKIGTELVDGDHGDDAKLPLRETLRHLHLAEYGFKTKLSYIGAPLIEELPAGFRSARRSAGHQLRPEAVAAE